MHNLMYFVVLVFSCFVQELHLLRKIHYISYLLLCLFSYSESKTHGKIFFPLVHFPSGLQWPQLNQSTARSFFQVSYMFKAAKHLDHPLLLSQAWWQELDWKWSIRDLNLYPYMCCMTVVGPKMHYYFIPVKLCNICPGSRVSKYEMLCILGSLKYDPLVQAFLYPYSPWKVCLKIDFKADYFLPKEQRYKLYSCLSSWCEKALLLPAVQ